MDRRTLLALALMAVVIIMTPFLFPSAKRPTPTVTRDSVTAPATGTTAATAAPSPTTQPTIGAPANAAPTAAAPVVRAAPETVVVAGTRATQTLVNTGAAPAAVRVYGYNALRPGHKDTTVLIAPTKGPLLRFRLATARDTIALDTIPFAVTRNGATTTFTSTSPAITLSYETADGLRTQVRGTVAEAPPGSSLLIDLPSDLRSNEADTLDDQRHLAYGYKIPLRDPESIPFSKLDVNEVRADTGSFQWVNTRNKYWILALMEPTQASAMPASATPSKGTPVRAQGVFRGMTMRGGVRAGRVAPTAYATTAFPIVNGQIAFDMYVGPQKFDELHAFNNDLENANPYAGFLHSVVQPFATIVMKVLLWMKATLRVNYGWVLVIFGVVIRLALWPLNNKAMRSSIQMQRLQPELQELQRKYKSDPEKQREAMMKLYASHNMSPFTPMLGCLPMLIPMPVLFALYHVFQNTVEFRGVSFLWLPDLSLRDPYFITPLAMGASMFLLSWIGMRTMPSNPQAKMMSYMMPVMMTLFFFNLASGLNLYYAVQNIAALPQQWFVTRERAKAGLTSPVRGPTPATAKRRT